MGCNGLATDTIENLPLDESWFKSFVPVAGVIIKICRVTAPALRNMRTWLSKP